MKRFIFNSNHFREVKSLGKKLLFSLTIIFTIGACVEDEFEEGHDILLSQSGYMYGIDDAAHGGRDGLYFLPPMVKKPNFNGVFNTTLSPVVEISDDFSFNHLHASFNTAGSGAQSTRVDQVEGHYIVNWQPSSTKAVAGRIYRVRVKVGDKILGHADVGLIRNGKDKVPPGVISRNVNSTFPIKFRIEGDHGSEAIPVRIALNPEEVNILKNENYQYTANVLDKNDQKIEGREVVWTVSDESLATIDANGVVRGLDYGYVTVTAALGSLTASSHLFIVDVTGARPGGDMIVLNNAQTFGNYGLSNPGNQLLLKNMINFYNLKSRGSGKTVWFDCGRSDSNYTCPNPQYSQFKSIVVGEGYDLEDDYFMFSLLDIPSDVKVIFLYLPISHYNLEEVNALKRFADEGGRLVLIGEQRGHFWGFIEANSLLLNLGTTIRMIPTNVECNRIPLIQTSIKSHSITRGVSTVSIGCSSVNYIGDKALPLIYDSNNVDILVSWALVNTKPITHWQEAPWEYR